MKLFNRMFYLLIFSVTYTSVMFSQTYNIMTENGNTINTCSGNFVASGGGTSTNYSNNENYTVTFCSTSGNPLAFDFFTCGSCDCEIAAGDTLYVYDGIGTGGTLITILDASDDFTFPQLGLSTLSTCVTFRFVSDGSGNDDGWYATISCDAPPTPCIGNPAAADVFGQAVYICNLNGYCGTTGEYYDEDRPYNLTGGGSCPVPTDGLFAGTLENNSWLQFQAASTSVDLDFTVTNCGTGGIQVGIFSFNGSSFTRVSDCAHTDGAWSGSFTVTASGLTPGETYYIMVDGNAGDICDYSISTNNTNIAVVNAGSDITICNGDAANLTATSPGTGTTFTWTWNNGAGGPITGANQSFTPSVTTTYVVEVTGGTYCQGTTDTVVVTVNSCSCTTTASATNTSICAGESVDLSANNGVSYVWDNGLGSGQTHTVTPASTTTYSVTMTDGGGCTATDNIQITVNPLPTAPTSVSATLTSVCSGNSTTLSYSGGSGTTFTWYTGSCGGTSVGTGNNLIVSPASSTTYYGGWSNGCGSSTCQSVTITVNPLPVAPTSVSATSTSICSGQSTTLSYSGGSGTTFTWHTGSCAGASVGTGNNLVVSPTSTTTYYGGWSNSCGSSTCLSVTITVNPLPAPTITGNTPFCTGNSITLDAGAGYTNYSWTGGTTNQTITVSAGGGYTLTVTDGNGCTGTDNVTVTENASPNPSITGALSFCTGFSTTLDAGVGYSTYNWAPSGSNQTINVTTGGNYAVTVTDGNGCTGSDNVTVTENSNLTPAISGNIPFCTGNSIILDAGNGYSSYIWSPSGSSQTLNVTAGGNYSVTVSDVYGCTGTDNVTVIENSNPSPVIVGNTPFCSGDSITLDAGSYLSYVWSPSGNTQILNVTAGGIYAVTVTDGNGCTGSDNVTVTEYTSPAPTITGIMTICSGESTLLDAGSGYNSYSWTGGGTSQTTTVITGGNYSVTVTDVNGCTGTDNVSVTENTSPVPSISGLLSFCTGENTTLDAGAGYSSYTWSPSGSTQTINVTAGGIYAVTITDGNGCTGSDNVTVTENSNPNPSISGTLSFCSGSNTILDAGAGYSIYNWTGGGTNQTFTVSIGGNYTVTVTDANGCTGTDNVTVAENPDNTTTNSLFICDGDSVQIYGIWQSDAGVYYDSLLTINGCDSVIITTLTLNPGANASITPVDPLCENDSYIILSVATTGGVFTGTGITDSTNGTFNPALAGTGSHEIIYTISGSCGNSDTITIQVDSVPQASIIGDQEIMFGGTATLMASHADSYFWTSSETIDCNNCQNIEVSPSETATYCVSASLNNGCSDSTCITVYVNKDCGELFIPSAFSPNGDGYNDILFVRGECISTIYFAIYDRWGEMMFESEDQNIGWEGTYKGKKLDDAVFVYYLKVLYSNKQNEIKTGNVSLIR